MSNPLRTLQSFVSSDPTAARCDLCSSPIGQDHTHLLQVETQQVRCVCPACAALFAHHKGGRFRQVPETVTELGIPSDDVATFIRLGLPVSLTWFCVRSPDGIVVANYPSPLGIVTSQIDQATWHQTITQNPSWSALQLDVEAVLVMRRPATRSCLRVPITDCFRLCGLLRTHWRGFLGGSEVWAKLDQFFADLSSRARVSCDGPEHSRASAESNARTHLGSPWTS